MNFMVVMVSWLRSESDYLESNMRIRLVYEVDVLPGEYEDIKEFLEDGDISAVLEITDIAWKTPKLERVKEED